MKSKRILFKRTVVSVMIFISGALLVQASGTLIESRSDLLTQLGAAAVTEDFEAYIFPDYSARRVGTQVDAASVIDGQGPGLVKPGVRFIQQPAGEGLQWDRQFEYGTTSAAMVSDDKLIVDFTVPVSHVGFDMFWFNVGYPLADPSTVQVYAANDVTLLYTTNIAEPFAPDSYFFGYADSGNGIGRIVLFRDEGEGFLGVSPMIDNLTFGAVPGATAAGISNYLSLDFSLTVIQQALEATNKNGDGKTYIWTVNKMKFNNKTLLKLLAEASGTSWPAGARLEYDLQSRQVVVADKTRTNILFICDDRMSHTNVYLTLSWDEGAGPVSGKVVQSNPDKCNLTANWQARFDIYFDSVGDWQLPTEFHASGLSVEKYSNKVTRAGNIANIQETFTPFSRGQLNGQSAVLTGKITAKGKTTDPLNLRPY
jgi:hypothetical protein